MNVLAFDTSTKFLALALFNKHKLTFYLNKNLDARHGESLSSVISKSLKKSKLTIGDIDALSVGVGPGSFTGLRVGLAMAKGLIFAKRIPCLSLSSMDLIACNFIKEDCNICILIDAKKGKLYCRFYQVRNSRLKPLSKFLLLDKSHALSRIGKAAKSGIHLSGDGIKAYYQDLKLLRGKIELAPEALWYPKAEGLFQLTLSKPQGDFNCDINRLKPLYLHKKECQIRKK